MVELFITVEYTGFATMFERSTGTPMSARMLNELKAISNKETVLLWHREMLRHHFTNRQTQYRNQPRKQPYSRIKKAVAEGKKVYVQGQLIAERIQRGGVIDNVRSGLLERQSRASSLVKTYPSRAVLVMAVPRYAAIRRRDSTMPYTPTEVTRTTEGEREKLRRHWAKTFVHNTRMRRDVIRKRLGS